MNHLVQQVKARLLKKIIVEEEKEEVHQVIPEVQVVLRYLRIEEKQFMLVISEEI